MQEIGPRRALSCQRLWPGLHPWPMATPAALLNSRRAIGTWLLACAAMVFVMVMLGGATRLTESGLSMVEWKPLTVLPPLSESQWSQAFHDYQQYPEFIKKNSWMTVDDFKQI